jgi:hypothetical protein
MGSFIKFLDRKTWYIKDDILTEKFNIVSVKVLEYVQWYEKDDSKINIERQNIQDSCNYFEKK